jgi:hypothetical protein
MTLTDDYRYTYRGLWDEGGVCRVRICQPAALIAPSSPP